MQQLTAITVIASLMLTPAVSAQPAVETDTHTETTTTFNSFNELSPGNKMIARSLLDAQTLQHDSTVHPWSLDDIAAARSETGWGNVFKQMQAEGLIEAKNLGEVVSAHARATHKPITESVAMEAGMSPDASAGEHEQHDQNGQHHQHDQHSDDTVMTETPADVDGAFENLSTGNKKIARSLMDAQTLPEHGSVEPWTLDQIAAAKDHTGWGIVFQQMQTEGLIDAKNLGQVVSQYQLNTLGITTGNGAAITTAASSSAGEHLPKHANGNASAHGNNGAVAAAGNGHNNAGITTAAGSANGNAYGLTKHTVSASDGITTAGGTTINVGTGAANNAGGIGSGNNNAAITAAGTNAASSSAAASVTTAGSNAGNGHGYAYGRNK